MKRIIAIILVIAALAFTAGCAASPSLDNSVGYSTSNEPYVVEAEQVIPEGGGQPGWVLVTIDIDGKVIKVWAENQYNDVRSGTKVKVDCDDGRWYVEDYTP